MASTGGLYQYDLGVICVVQVTSSVGILQVCMFNYRTLLSIAVSTALLEGIAIQLTESHIL